MTSNLDYRLNQILPKITSDEFLRATGLGNELAFHIFDYPPEEELRVRDHIRFLLEQIPKKRPKLRVAHANLLDFLVDYLRQRRLLDRSFKMQRDKGDEALMKALRGPLNAKKLAEAFAEAHAPDDHDLILVSGVGSAYPLIRTHLLLNNLHSVMGQVPLVLFYPGRYDGVTLRLFGKSSLSVADGPSAGDATTPYYRAFRLIPEDPKHAH